MNFSADIFEHLNVAFICEVDVGTHIHDMPKPDPGYHCEHAEDIYNDYLLYNDEASEALYPVPQCYSQSRKSTDGYGNYTSFVEYCKSQNAVPASIHSASQNAFHVSFLKGSTWLGMDTWGDPQPKIWPYDNTPFDFTAWGTLEPETMNKPTLFITSDDEPDEGYKGQYGTWRVGSSPEF